MDRTGERKEPRAVVLAWMLVLLSASAVADTSCTKNYPSEGKGRDLANRIDALIEKRLPMLARKDFHLSGERLTDEELAAILADQRVPELHFLTLSDNQLTATAVETLLHSAKTKDLRWLHLSSNPIGDTGLAALAASDRLEHVTFLSLVAVKATARGVQALSRDRLPAIETLQLGWQALGDDGAYALAKLPPLKKLDLMHSEIAAAGARALLSGTGAENLILAENPIGTGGLRGLASLGARLRSLDLTQTGLGAEDAAILANLDLALKHLSLTRCPLGDEGLQHLARAPWLGRLESLDVMYVKSSPAGRRQLRTAWGQRAGLTIERD
jgi:Ran GTPase-activating protein (RanGAP) involved in mRNA processing and transport